MVDRPSSVVILLVSLVAANDLKAMESESFLALGTEYVRDVQPLLKQFCLDCHSTKDKEGELDLERFRHLASVRQDPASWQKVAEMLDNGEMPPDDSQQLTAEQRNSLRGWVGRYLDAEARANAGDPGPVVLRRLNNAEYSFTVRDLTGVQSLDPARQFPVDSAAGEGFTNTGNSLVMSPALVQKYLDAGKEIAAHVVLLPDGFRFTASKSRRDWSDEVLAEIRLLYARHTSGDTNTSMLDRWSGVAATKSTENDGRVPLERYLSALIRYRDRLRDDIGAVDPIANDERLNSKYLRQLAVMLTSAQSRSILLEAIRQHWEQATVEETGSIAAEIRGWQDQLWKFNTVGHLGLVRAWQEPVNPLPESITLRQPLSAATPQGNHVTLFLVAGNAGSGDDGDWVLWQRPRIEFKDRPAILLRDVGSVAAQIQESLAAELGRTELYLTAVRTLSASAESIEQTADKHGLNPVLLKHWTAYVQLGQQTDRAIRGHFTNKLTKAHGYDAVNGWGMSSTPNMLTNRSDQPISFLTLTVPPRGVTVHPSPTQSAVVSWRSPLDGTIRVEGKVADADDKCGNGAAWQLDLLSRMGTVLLASGVIDNGRDSRFQPESTFEVRRGDVVSLAVSARDQNHVCDTTQVDLRISEVAGEKRLWNLAADVVDKILEGNPLPDSFGNLDTWHFTASGQAESPKSLVPPGSTLARWRAAVADSKSESDIAQLAAAVQKIASAASTVSLNASDKAFLDQLSDWHGPLKWISTIGQPQGKPLDDSSTSEASIGIDPANFGRHPQGKPIDPASLVVKAPDVLEIRLPTALVNGGELVVDATLDPHEGREGSVQAQVLTQKVTPPSQLVSGQPIITRSDSAARKSLIAAYEDFRRLFPAAMCHARIVPVDEVVTLLLYHREDHHLADLMLDDAEKARLDRLWDELHYISEDALRIEVALEQILEFATQDADPRRFDPVRKPIAEGAAAFRERLVATQPAHLDALIDFASRAYRRALTQRESDGLLALYRRLREEEIPHEQAFRLMLARVLASPAFLYRLEQPAEGAEPAFVSDQELATRLSYFFWSSLPDKELRAEAEASRLHDPQTLVAQSRRMLKDERIRRLAIEFACQWLHLRDFDQTVEKSERHFPTFAGLRGDMYEESVRFFTDMFQNDGSILNLIDADHTFLNDRLADHYAIPSVEGPSWRRVEGVRAYSRGGILTQATMLASQSGASRTSPILRGTWISETLLGERLPRPPKGVPQLPDTVPEQLTERQLIERHSSDAACAKCHARIDPYGFALESFDAIGRFRKTDEAGHPIDTRTTLIDSSKIGGIDDLRDYLLTKRRDAIVRQFCRKLLGYSLGRAVQLSDEPLLDEMMERLAKDDYRFSVAAETIVLSDQFRKIRGVEQRSGTKHEELR